MNTIARELLAFGCGCRECLERFLHVGIQVCQQTLLGLSLLPQECVVRRKLLIQVIRLRLFDQSNRHGTLLEEPI